MKKATKLLLLGVIAVFFTACESYFGDINKNPNRPITVSEDVILPAVQVSLADTYGGEYARYSSMLTQQIKGIDRCGSYYLYVGILPYEFSNTWANHYVNIVNQGLVLKNQANEKGFHHVEAVANILIAFQIIQASDLWGDMPWSEAFQGFDELSPTFDSHRAIYDDAENLLLDAIDLLHGEDGGLQIKGDLIYNGDVELWKKAAYGLLARAAIHWSGVDASKFQAALNFAQQSFADNAEELALQFIDSETNAAPMYRYNRDRPGHFVIDPRFKQTLISLNDTARLSRLDYDFYNSHGYFTADYRQPLLTYRELKFIEAEALIRTNGDAAAIHQAYLEGIRAAFEHFEVADHYQDYVNQNVINPGQGAITLDHILLQKYISLYALPEAFNDWRRTEYPTLTPTRGTQIPLRFPYPESELVANPNTPTVDIMQDRVGWDVN